MVRAARAFTPVELATIELAQLKDVYIIKGEALTDEERLEEDIERDRDTDEMNDWRSRRRQNRFC